MALLPQQIPQEVVQEEPDIYPIIREEIAEVMASPEFASGLKQAIEPILDDIEKVLIEVGDIAEDIVVAELEEVISEGVEFEPDEVMQILINVINDILETISQNIDLQMPIEEAIQIALAVALMQFQEKTGIDIQDPEQMQQALGGV